MIGNVTRGRDVARLLAYLYGSGRSGEHVAPHLVAGFHLPEALEPARGPGGGPDVRPLAGVLTSSLVTLRHQPMEQPIWQCSLRVAPGDRRLSDDEWAGIATEVVHQTGFAPRGDEFACRWVAVRHADDHIHLVVALAREDGRNPSVYRDYQRVRSACRLMEGRYGLTRTASADRTATPRPTRAENERATRAGQEQAPRHALRRLVTAAVTASTDQETFFARLEGQGVVLRRRFSSRDSGEVTGYAVALRGHVNRDGEPVWFSGGKLAPELTLPKLRRRWDSAGQDAASVWRGSPWAKPFRGAADLGEACRATARATAAAAREMS